MWALGAAKAATSSGVLFPKVCGGGAEKSAAGTIQSPVLKLTQVGEESILRRSRERS
jgi:hypothetical protein